MYLESEISNNSILVNRFGDVPLDFEMDDVKCVSTEGNIDDCPRSSAENCGAKEGAGVICLRKSTTL